MKLDLKGSFIVERWFNGKLVKHYKFKNTIVKEGKNHAFNSVFGLTAQIEDWFIGLISGTSFVRVLTTDTQAVHAGWVENTAYDEATRPAFAPALSTNCTLESDTATVFTMNVSSIIKGIFISSNSTKSGTTGVLWAAALKNIDAIAGEELRVSYKVEA